MPEINVRNNNINHTTDDNLLWLRTKEIARSYRESGILTERQYEEFTNMTDYADAMKYIRDIQVPDEMLGKFCVAYVGQDTTNFNNAPVQVLPYAYVEKRESGDAMARALAARIDDMSADFANSGGMVLENGTDWPLVEFTNAATCYEAFSRALSARMADLDPVKDAEKITEMKSNISQMQLFVQNYDRVYGLDKVRQNDAPQYDRHCDELTAVVNHSGLFASNIEVVKKYNFTDENGNLIPQFLKNGELDKEGRAAAILDLTRGDVVRRRITSFGEKIDTNAIEQELNEEFLFKLYEIANADKIVQMAKENPEVFTEPERRNEFMRDLVTQGGDISNEAYNAALDENEKSAFGWCARLKMKLGTAAEKIGNLWDKVVKKNNDVDRFANVRVSRTAANLRQKRREMCLRILKGFASGFVASVLITTIATAAAATAGISMAASVAAIGIVTAIGMGVVQVNRWRRRQQDAGLPTDIRAFLADKRLVTSLGVSAIAVVAMCFGAGGMADAAMALGYGALALGGTKNAIESYRDARDSRMSVAESIAWAIANAGAVVGGGLTGRYVANVAIDAYNNANPENRLFQNATDRTVEHTNTTTETRTEYTADALDNAEKIARMWYRDNPDILQQRVDAINAYNAEHGTNIDPYRAIMINGDAGGQTFDNMRLHVNNSHIDPNVNDIYSHGHHRVLTDAWGRANGFTHEELNAAARLFNPDGSVNANGMNVVSRLDGMVGESNTVGYVDGRPVQTDGYFKPNDAAGWTTYTDGRPAMVENTYETTETTYENVTDYTRARGDGMAAYGNYNPRERRTKLRDRIGTFWDRINNEPPRRDEPVTGKDDNPFTPVAIEKPVLEPVLEDKPLDEVIADDAPVTENPDVNFDDVFVAPVDAERDDEKPKNNPFDLSPVAPIVKEENREDVYTLDPENEPVIEPVLDDNEKPVAVADDKILALTRPQAKSWKDLNERLKKVRAKLDKGPQGSKAAKLRAEESKLTYLINKLCNQVGHYDYAAIDRASKEALLREDLNQKAALIEAGPGENATKWDELDWRSEIAQLDYKIQKKIEKFGEGIEANARADESRLLFPTPVPGIQRQKKNARGDMKLPSENELHPHISEVIAEQSIAPVKVEQTEHKPTRAERRAAREAEKAKRKDARRAEYEKMAASMPQKVERFNLVAALKRAIAKEVKNDRPERAYFVPESLEKLVANANLISEPITTIRGIPVRLVDLGGNGNPITQNREHPMVVVEMIQTVVRDGLKDTDLIRVPFYLATGLENRAWRPTGHWYPLSNVQSNGDILVEENYNTPELLHIAAALDERIGDIRNWRDDALTQKRELAGRTGFVGGADAMQHVNPDKVKDMVCETIYDNHALYNYSKSRAAVAHDWMENALAHIQSVDWAEHKRRIGAGIKKIGKRALSRFGFGNEDYEDEYEH